MPVIRWLLGRLIVRASNRPLDLHRRIGVHALKDMAVRVEGERHTAVAEPFGGDFGVDAGNQKRRGVAMAEVVPTDGGR